MKSTDIAIQRATEALIPVVTNSSGLTRDDATLIASSLVGALLESGLVIQEQLVTQNEMSEAYIADILTKSGEHIAQFFSFAHLPTALQVISKPFSEMATRILVLPRNPERTVALRKLLESKDAAVRAFIAKDVSLPAPIPALDPVADDPAFSFECEQQKVAARAGTPELLKSLKSIDFSKVLEPEPPNVTWDPEKKVITATFRAPVRTQRYHDDDLELEPKP